VDGVDGAGKTCFGDELGSALASLGRPVIRSSVDGFHRPRAARYARGSTSPEGYYLDSYDYPRLRSALLDPLGPGGSRSYRTAVFDYRTDRPVDVPSREAPSDAVLVLDGLFLHRPELRPCWDFSIFLRVDFATTFARMAVRDGCPPDPGDAANRRYVEGQRIYLASASPESYATVVVDNNDLARPFALPEGAKSL
jgi:uridine kinase